MRVVHVIGGLQLGGAETLLYRIVTAPSASFAHEVICLGRRDWYSDRLESQGITVHHLGMTSAASTLRGLSALRRLIRASNADVIQCWMYLANLLGGLLRPSRTPVVWGIHNSTFDHVGLASRLCAFAGGAGTHRLTDYVVNCSRRSAELHAKLGYSGGANAVIPNGYDPAEFFPDQDARASVRASLGIGHKTFLIGGISRWHAQKDVPNLLRAVRLAADGEVRLRCLLIGRGLERQNTDLVAAIDEAGLEDVVTPLGPRSDVRELARALDLHVLSSSGGEAFPNVVAETMLSGTPNAVTDVGDAGEMVADTGWVVRPHDPVALAAAIEQAYREWREDRANWEQRRQRARGSIVDRFTFDRMVEAYERVWREVLTKSLSRAVK